jgi:transcriptional regulator with XRE-family HTH domain
MSASTFGQLISQRRKALGLSQKEFASRIKKKQDGESISAQYLNDIEHDRRNPPSEFLIEQFAHELKLKANVLCLASGTLPQDAQQEVTGSRPDVVERAYLAFRRELKGN